MIAPPRERPRPRLEVLDRPPGVEVVESEYRRLLGYPRDHVPGERSAQLAAWARQTFAEIGRPWLYLREANLELGGEPLRIDDRDFASPQLHRHLRQTGARRVVLLAVSAGAAAEERARALWADGRPDEYFFLEMLASAVVEHLVTQANARVCAFAEQHGLAAVPHYSPGYTGWNVAEQNALFDLIAGGRSIGFPEPLEVLSSGMLRPKKSLLAVIGLAAAGSADRRRLARVPCEGCAYSPCHYRRAPYRFAPAGAERVAPPEPAPVPARYSVNVRALRRWAEERVQLADRADGTREAVFRFDGTTCSNLGQPLAFEYRVTLAPAVDGWVIRQADCRPAPGDEGHTAMCAYVTDPDGLMRAIAGDCPLLGQPLDQVLAWRRTPAPSGCYCDAAGRAHKWGLALEAIHFALAQTDADPAVPARAPLS